MRRRSSIFTPGVCWMRFSSKTVTLAGVSAEIFSVIVMEVRTGSSFAGSGACCAASRNGKHIRIEHARAHPTRFAELLRRGSEHKLIVAFVKRRLRGIGSLGINQSQVSENSIYVAVLGLPEGV